MSGPSIVPSGDDDKAGDSKLSNFTEEKCRRIMAEATRLAGLAPGEWRIWIDANAEHLHISRETLETLIDDIITANEKKAREKAAADRRSAQMAERARKDAEKKNEREQKKKERAEAEQSKAGEKEAKAQAKLKAKEFATIARLPVADRDTRLQKLAERLKEDVSEIREQFAEYLDSVTSTSATSIWDIEAWDEPVAASALLQELTDKIQKHVVMAPHQAVAVALWIMLAWIHDVAANYSPYLVATSADRGEGKSTLILDVVGRLTPRPFPGGEPTPATVFRTADAHKPTLLFDDVDTLFERKPELTSIFKIGHERGAKIPRMERIGGAWMTQWFDPFTPKACNLIGTKLPSPLHSRCILIRLRKKKASEVVTKPKDDEEFATLCRKLKRWSDDNAAALKDAPPSPAFINRESDNWNLQLAIAELAGCDWPVRALEAARVLTRTMYEPSWLELLLADFQDVFKNRKDITSEAFRKLIMADQLSVWRDYGRGKITQRQIAHLLRGIGIFPVNIGTKRIRGYRAADFVDAFERYLPGRRAGGHGSSHPLFRSRRWKAEEAEDAEVRG